MYAGKADAKNTSSSVIETNTNTDPADDIIVLAVNVYWEAQPFRLPELPEDICFQVIVNTAIAEQLFAETKSFHKGALSKTGGGMIVKKDVEIAPRSVQVFRMIPCLKETYPLYSE